MYIQIDRQRIEERRERKKKVLRDEQTKCKKGRHTPRHAFVCRGGINRESSFKSFVEVKKEGDKVYYIVTRGNKNKQNRFKTSFKYWG